MLFKAEQASSFSSPMSCAPAPRYLCDVLQHHHVFLLLGSPKLDIALKMWSHKCQKEEEALCSASSLSCRYANSSHCHKSVLLTQVKLVCQESQVPSCRAAPQPVSPNACVDLSHLRCRTPWLSFLSITRLLPAHSCSLLRVLSLIVPSFSLSAASPQILYHLPVCKEHTPSPPPDDQ